MPARFARKQAEPHKGSCPCAAPIESKLLVAVFALLVGDGAGGLAGRLAGGLAFAAATLHGAFAEVLRVQRFDVFHCHIFLFVEFAL